MQIDHIHFYVEDAQKWRDWFVYCLGFQVINNGIFPSLSHHQKSLHTCTEVVKSGTVCFLLSSPILPTSPVAEFLRQHPPGVADVAFAVDNVEALTAKAISNGAKILQPLQNAGFCQYAKIAGWGGLNHTLMTRNQEKIAEVENSLYRAITAIDHLVLNVGVGELETAVNWYQKIFDFQPQQSFQIKTDRSGLHSQVMISPHGNIQLPINEPASPSSQIQEFLDVNRGAGIQHIALMIPDLVNAISRFRGAGLSFLSVPQNYYFQLQQRHKFSLSTEELQAISDQEILVDWHEDAPLGQLLLQIFSQPIFSEPTFFFEFIERRSLARGFGEGNFLALFQAIEREQIKRGFVSS
ncbi:MAG: 4-hydroxyphenylpyruvate dioxygenase [Aphanizomenon flos-aquae MDT14a]|uniref:4-hydroxyphenylpyruvate dioxygenase n=1 Tax=Aphanizomenon flos-aquae LD13 TaxID=1710894 RepID=A0A1B7VH98_APHFL|nr:4-hydroxyphenylpyruvate dioxygenase [Aphanizomenon flos-aquae UKL13-PB]MBO1062649.1 4-hydroxyphenylpyruvate dioxygenase [Aphanizomenon flos-aquae CP01]OBQ17502.1 MAG: 4-hydroxyphenylpyruvate dioxygenase [Aphanizomenon flos-aquae LD13]OBQ27651.1 MAG: 4-hydroxyphenylpyruvate dioxygenase [Aphanizomenon flos-aquae MDT14a]HCQ22106.1 4-hydroxyphenylpyruvate dioxygenase [Anabaena sp. UBA12330]